MVALIPFAEIEALNIDTVERAIVFAALALRAAIVGADNSNNQSREVTINSRVNRDNTVTLSITAYLLFNAYNFYGSGGNLVDNIIEFSTVENDLSVKLDFVVEPSNPINPVIPDYPENTITTFEQYLLYYSLILFASLSEKRNNFVKLSFLGGIKGDAQLKLTLAIPIQLDSWLLGDNYVNSTQRLVDSYTVPIEESQTEEETDSNLRGILTNEDLLTNEILLINQVVTIQGLTNDVLLDNSVILTN